MTDKNTTEIPAHWLPQTKLAAPRASDDVLARPRLLADVEQAIRRGRLTLISAPPGSGKTTLLAGLSQALCDLPQAWMLLDEDDNDNLEFTRLLLATLEKLMPGCAAAALDVLQNQTAANLNLRPVMAALINRVVELGPPGFVLAIDDLHILSDGSALRAFEYLIDYLPPGMHVLAATRYDPPLPLSRWRARGHLAEFRLDRLRFADAEIAGWLNEQLELGLTADALRLVQQQTEGWAAGVRLLALSLAEQTGAQQREALLAQLGQSRQDIYGFLLEEVLERQEPPLRRFLLETSILRELTAEICQAVTGNPDAAGLLAEIYRRSLFISRQFDHDSQPSYRYHPLFAQFLNQQLRQRLPDRIGELHRRAGEAQALPLDAARHYLEAEAWDAAAAALKAAGKERLESGHLDQVEALIERFPTEIRQKNPWLGLLQGSGELQRGRYDTALPQLRAALAGFEQSQDEDGQTEALAQLGEVYTCLGEVGAAAPTLDRLLKRRLPVGKRIKAQINRTWSAFYCEDWPGVDIRLTALIEEVMAGDSRSAYASLVLSLGPQYPFAAGGMDCLEKLCRQALALFPENSGLLTAGAQAYLAYLAALRGDFDEAQSLAEQARRLTTELGGAEHLEIYPDHVFLFSALIQGELDDFQRQMAGVLERVETVFTYRQFLPCYLYLKMRAHWLAGEPEAALQIAERMEHVRIVHELPEGRLARRLMMALAGQIRGDFELAEAILNAALPSQAHVRHSLLSSHVNAALARLHWAAGNKEQALDALAPLITEVERRQMPGVVLQEGPDISPILKTAYERGVLPEFLARHTGQPQPDSAPINPFDDSGLSKRELEVLRLVAGGLSNAEIAARLFITPGTAKRHSINIYRKLGVGSRTQAIALARQRGWV